MRVIHGIWAHGGLCLWAEDPDLPRSSRDPAVSRAAWRPSAPRPHPYACQSAELADLLAGLPGPAAEAARKAVDDELTLQLPSAGTGPLPSPGAIRRQAGLDGPAARGPGRRVALARWRVPAVAFDPAAALALLGGLDGLDDPGVTAGGSLPYLAAVARFAADLAARGRVLPVLAAEDACYAARWRPVLGGADAQRGRDLAAAMPPSCRAVDAEPPGTLLADALESLTDAAARSRLPGSLLPARRGRTPARLPMAERFVVALTAPDARLEVVTPQDEAQVGNWPRSLTPGWTGRGSRPARCGPASGSPSRAERRRIRPLAGRVRAAVRR